MNNKKFLISTIKVNLQVVSHLFQLSREHNGGEMLHMFYPTGQFQMKGEQVCGNEETKNLIQFLSIIGKALLT